MTGRFGAQLVSLLLSFVLTRLLTPEDFGVAGIAMVLIFFSSLFIDIGFSRALVQKKETGQAEYSSVFFLNLLLGILFTVICFFTAKPLAGFYDLPRLDPVLKVLSLLFFINSLSLVPGSILVKQMKFKHIAITGLISAWASGIAGIVLALKGFGVWSLVVQYLIAAVLALILNFIFAGWRPILVWSRTALQPLWKYGSRMFSATILGSTVSRLDIFIIAKLFPAATLGFYTRAQSIDSTVKSFSAGSITAVFFPAAARLQDDRRTLSAFFRKYLHVVSFLSAGLSGFLYLVTPDLFRVLFTERWDMAAGYFQIMCIAGVAWPMSALMVSLISATGNSKIYLRLELLRIMIQLPVFIFGLAAGIATFLWLFVAARLLSMVLNSFFVSKEIPIKTREQLSLIFLYLFQAAIAALLTAGIMEFAGDGSRMFRIGLITISYFLFYLLAQALTKTFALKQLVILYNNNFATRV